VIGTGIFTLTVLQARNNAGPAIAISFAIADAGTPGSPRGSGGPLTGEPAQVRGRHRFHTRRPGRAGPAAARRRLSRWLERVRCTPALFDLGSGTLVSTTRRPVVRADLDGRSGRR
jgi:hypothetical protein